MCVCVCVSVSHLQGDVVCERQRDQAVRHPQGTTPVHAVTQRTHTALINDVLTFYLISGTYTNMVTVITIIVKIIYIYYNPKHTTFSR